MVAIAKRRTSVRSRVSGHRVKADSAGLLMLKQRQFQVELALAVHGPQAAWIAKSLRLAEGCVA